MARVLVMLCIVSVLASVGQSVPVEMVTGPTTNKDDIENPSFETELYPVKWNVRSIVAPGPTNEGGNENPSFETELYPVKWNVRHVVAPGTAHAHHAVKVKPGMLFAKRTMVPRAVLAEGMTFGAGGNRAPTSRTFAFKKIPFAYKNITSILRTFRIPPWSKKAEQIAYTLQTCEESAPAGELQTCATSAEAMQEFASAALGISNPQKLVSVVRGATEPARYMIAQNGITEIGGGKQQGVVACHPMPYPYTVHYCHAPKDVQAYRVELTGGLLELDGNAARTSAIAMCHTNTTTWDDHFFRLLNATRGDVICHFMALNYVLWMASPAA